MQVFIIIEYNYGLGNNGMKDIIKVFTNEKEAEEAVQVLEAKRDYENEHYGLRNQSTFLIYTRELQTDRLTEFALKGTQQLHQLTYITN